MADVFIAYKREDKARVTQLHRALTRLGLDVWFDAYLEIGVDWRPQVEREIEAARAVIVCWTPAACGSGYVAEEARRGLEREVLVSVRFEPCAIPTLFDAAHAPNLSQWNGDPTCVEFGAVLQRLQILLGRSDLARASELQLA